jgi:hypothetical protein
MWSDEVSRSAMIRTLHALLIVGGAATVFAGIGAFQGSSWQALLFSWSVLPAIAVGLGVAAWAWAWRVAARIVFAASLLVALACAAMAAYMMAVPTSLVAVSGSAAVVAGSLGLSFRGSLPDPGRFLIGSVAVVASIAAVSLLFCALVWPPQGKRILLGLPLLAHMRCDINTEPGGIWSAYWGVPHVAPSAAVGSIKSALAKDGWTITSNSPDPSTVVDAAREGWFVEVLYEPDAPKDYWSTGAYMAAYVRRGPMRP